MPAGELAEDLVLAVLELGLPEEAVVAEAVVVAGGVVELPEPHFVEAAGLPN